MQLIYHKKGEKISVPISTDLKYKVLSSNGYETPKGKEKHRYAGKCVRLTMEDGTVLNSIYEHEYLKSLPDGTLIECKAKNLLIGDQFLHIDGYKRISKIEEFDYDGFIYSFVMPSRDYYVNDYLTKNCCRLRLDLRQLTRKNGSLFGAADNTGSIGVVTLNLPKIGYLSKNEDELFQRINALMVIAKDSLEIKRKVIQQRFDDGLYPYSKRYLTSGFSNHFSTIGLVGANEMCRNYFRNTKKKDLSIATEHGYKLTIKVLDYMRNRLSDFQEETGNLYNLESTPAESTAYRFAMHDKKKYPDIITAGTIQNPYYTNSTNLPVGYTTDPWVAIENQSELQSRYNGGCVTLETEVDIQ